MNDITAPIAPPVSPGPAPSPAPTSAPPSGVIDDAIYDSLSVADQDRYSRVRKGPDGGSIWRERATLQSEIADPSKTTADTSATAPTVTPDGRLRVGEYELSSEDVSMLMQQKAANDLRKTQMPEKAEAYEAKLPETLQLPDDVEFSFNVSDPAYVGLRGWAHSQGFTQEQFSSILGHYAASEAAKEAAFRASMKAEVGKLGEYGTMRVSALQTFFRGVVGDDLAKAVCSGLFSSKQVQALELVAKKMGSQGAASFSQAHREPATGGRGPLSSMSDAEYSALSASEKYAIAKRG